MYPDNHRVFFSKKIHKSSTDEHDQKLIKNLYDFINNIGEKRLEDSDEIIFLEIKKTVELLHKDNSLDFLVDGEHNLVNNLTLHQNYKSMELLLSCGANPNISDKYGNLPIHLSWIHQSQKLKFLKLFHSHGADLNKKLSKSKIHANVNPYYMPMHFAVKFGNLDVVKFMVENGANINVQVNSGYTSLMFAIVHESYKMMEYLLEKGADLNIKDNKSALHFLLSNTYNVEPYVNILIEYGADINEVDHTGETPIFGLNSAADWPLGPDINNLKLAIKLGANLNFVNSKGKTILHYIVSRGINLEFTKILVSSGTNVNIKDHNGRTPIYWFISDHKCTMNISMVKFFLDYGAKIDFEFEHFTINEDHEYEDQFMYEYGHGEDKFKLFIENRIQELEEIKELLRNSYGNNSLKQLCFNELRNGGFSFENLPESFFN